MPKSNKSMKVEMRALQRRKNKKPPIKLTFTGAKSDKPTKMTTTHEGRRFEKAELLVKTQL